MSVPDYALISNLFPDQTIFDEIFISGAIGMRKPDVRFFSYVLEEIHAMPQNTIFVDDKLFNVMAAQSLGIRALVCKNTQDTVRELRSTLDCSVKLQEQILYPTLEGFSSIVTDVEIFDDDCSQA